MRRATHGPSVQHRAHQSPPISFMLPYALFDHFLAAPRAGPLLRCCPHAHDLPFTAGPCFAVLDGSCGLAPAHFEQAVRQPAELFRTLDGALTDFLLFLEPRYGRARTRAAIEPGAEYGCSSVSFISCCGSSFRFLNTQVWIRLARVKSLMVHRSSRRIIVQGKAFIVFV